MKKITMPLKKNDIKRLRAGDDVLLSGPVFTARDAAHKRLIDTLKKGGKLPVALKGATIYYTGPTDTPPGRVIGSCGPTTSSRMDRFTPALLRLGLKGMIGKGRRGEDVRRAVMRYGAVYFLALAGAGAFLAEKVRGVRVVAYNDLGCEAIHELILEDFPVVVGIGAKGKDIYGGK